MTKPLTKCEDTLKGVSAALDQLADEMYDATRANRRDPMAARITGWADRIALLSGSPDMAWDFVPPRRDPASPFNESSEEPR